VTNSADDLLHENENNFKKSLVRSMIAAIETTLCTSRYYWLSKYCIDYLACNQVFRFRKKRMIVSNNYLYRLWHKK